MGNFSTRKKGSSDTVEFNPLIKVKRLNSVVNSEGLEYGPCLTNNEKILFFISDGPLSVKNSANSNKPSHDLLMAIKNDTKDEEFSYVINPDDKNTFNDKYNQGIAVISYDFKKIYYTECTMRSGYGDCDIFVADISFEYPNIRINNVKNLGPNINSSNWEVQPAISPDNKT
jgi:hypothetical protein